MENNSENHDLGSCETQLDENEQHQTDEMPTLAHQMLNAVSNFLAEGEEGSRAVELLVDGLDSEILADMVLEAMKNLPESPPINPEINETVQQNYHFGRLGSDPSVDMVLEPKEELPESPPILPKDK